MWLLAFLLLAAVSTAFNICDFKDATPEFYYSCSNDECPPKFILADNGIDCIEYKLDGSTCASFCQMRTKFYYGQEQPFHRIPICRGGEICRITETVHQNYGWKVKTNGNFKEGALTEGVSRLFELEPSHSILTAIPPDHRRLEQQIRHRPV
jgi:hypothetical protein